MIHKICGLKKLKIPPEEYDCKIKTQKIWRFTIPIRGACSLIRCYARDLTKTGTRWVRYCMAVVSSCCERSRTDLTLLQQLVVRHMGVLNPLWVFHNWIKG